MSEEIKIGDEIRVGTEGRNAFNVVVFLVGKRLDGVIVYQCMASKGNHFIYTSEDNMTVDGMIHLFELLFDHDDIDHICIIGKVGNITQFD